MSLEPVSLDFRSGSWGRHGQLGRFRRHRSRTIWKGTCSISQTSGRLESAASHPASRVAPTKRPWAPLVTSIKLEIPWLSDSILSSFRSFKFIPKLDQTRTSNLFAKTSTMASMAGDVSVAVDDRDLNHFALNPSCNVTWRQMISTPSAANALPRRKNVTEGWWISLRSWWVRICIYICIYIYMYIFVKQNLHYHQQ